MTISVFGGTGFVGGAFVASRDDCVVAPRGARKPSGDEVVYFISTTDNYGPVEGDLQRDVDTNLCVFMEVLDTLRGAQPVTINFCSSWFVYGDAQVERAREDGPCRPLGFYGATKLCAEHLLMSFCRTFGHHYRIFRLCNVYGGGDRGASAKKNALTWLVGRIAAGEEVPLYYGGDVTRDFLHVEDAAKAISACIDQAPLNTVINIGSGESVSFARVIQLAAAPRGTYRMRHVAPSAFHEVVQVRHFSMDVSRLRLHTDFTPSISLEQGMADLYHALVETQ